MKKATLFIIVFIAAYFLIQIGSGMLLTMFYTPDFSMGTASSSGIMVSKNEWISGLIIAVIALGIAFWITNKFATKNAH
jgi:hypothetical protein